MPQLLALIIFFNLIAVVRGNALMLISGLSVKNALLYLAVALMFTSGLLGKKYRVELPKIFAAFGLLIAYAMVSAVIVANSEIYPHYSLMASLFRIKGDQLDWACFFAVFSVGLGTRRDCERTLQLLVAAVGIANVITIWNAAGLPRIGADVYNPEVTSGLRRIDGFFGHANESASLVVLFLPIMIALIFTARGAARTFWLALCAASVMTVVGTASRGALVGLVGGSLFAAARHKRFVSFDKFARWGAVAFLLALLVVPLAGMGYIDKFVERFTGVSMVSATDISSGRSELWTMGFNAMLRRPWSLITGVGWNTWAVQGFTFLPHNQYLWMYFDMGIVGLACFIYVWISLYKHARRAVFAAPTQEERYLPLAFVFAIPIWCISMTFSNISTPWIFVWPLAGVIARYSYFVIEDAQKQAPAARAGAGPRPPGKRRDPYSLPPRKPVAKTTMRQDPSPRPFPRNPRQA